MTQDTGFAEALARARADPGDAAALIRLAEQAIASGEEEVAAPILAAGAECAGTDARLWQAAASLHRALYRQEEALAAFERAAELAPGDGAIAYGLAYATLEAGLDAVERFEAARRIEPTNGSLILGLQAARFAVGEGARGLAELDALLVEHPGWTGGHGGFAQLSCLMGEPEAATRTIERALAAHPGDPGLWRQLAETLLQGERYAEMIDAIRRGRAASGDSPFFDANEALVLSELGDAAGADAMFAKVAHIEDVALAVRRVRHLLRTGRLAEALPLIDRWIGLPEAAPMWPVASVAWRMAGDARWEWLEGDPRLVSVVNLTEKLPPLDRLAAALRAMHPAGGQPLAQSVRGGTQTDGILFTRVDPEIRLLHAAIVDAVGAHIAQLPPPDPAHPTLSLRRDRPVRFSGAWSVRLSGGGHHSSHVHTLGWFSSALYVALPPGDAGTLILGEPPEEFGHDLPPLRRIEPRPGQLVLFPSTMWHRTAPFAEGERLTVAFDVAPPR